MDERSLEKIKKHLQDTEAQERIQQSIQRGRLEATVTIGRVAQLFDVKESRIRDWESRGLLTPLRSKEKTGQRQYSPSELDKLAIIKELVDEGGFGPADIPSNIENIWDTISGSNGQQVQALKPIDGQAAYLREVDLMPIDKRVNNAYYQELFWRYYCSRALRLSLALIREEMRFTRAGLILPLHTKNAFTLIQQSEDLPKVGESLVGWSGQSRSFYTFLTPAPSFHYPSDFHILPLQVIEEGILNEGVPKDNTLLAIPRAELEGRPFTLSTPVVETILRLLNPLYSEVPDWHLYLGQGLRDIVDPLIDFNNRLNLADIILTRIAKRVVHLGGRTSDGQYRWRFCCISTPNNPHLPLKQRSLVVRAKTRETPPDYKVGTTLVSPDVPIIGMSLRAFQSGRIIYRHMVTSKDPSIAHLDKEGPIGSAIAVPAGGEDGIPVAVLYVVSAYADAFSEDDQRVLRLLGRMVEELLKTYEVRIQVTEQLTHLIKNPSIVDPLFEAFASENEFISDAEALLDIVREKEVAEIPNLEAQYTTKEALSFIAIDIDNLTSLTNKFGDQMTNNLSKVVGLKLQNKVRALFTNSTDCKLYHMYADRYYLLLNRISLEEAKAKAEVLRQTLNGSYQIGALRSPSDQPTPSESMLDINDVTVRLAVSSYTYNKLQEVLLRYPAEIRLSSTTAEIRQGLDEMLKVGLDEGGNVIISWDPQIWAFRHWTPAD